MGKTELTTMRLTRLLSFLAILTVITLPVLAQGSLDESDLTAKDVISKCVLALGGNEAWQSIKSMTIKGEYTSFTEVMPFVMKKKRPNLYRFDHAEGSRRRVVAYDGKTAWWESEVALISQANWPLLAPEPYASSIRFDADFEPPFINYLKRGLGVELIGMTTLELEKYVELRVIRPEGKTERWFLDPSTFLPAVSISTAAYLGKEWGQKKYYDNYKEVAGLFLPHQIDTELGNGFESLHVETIQVNTEIDSTIFDLPLSPGMNSLQRFLGHWEVSVESRDRFGPGWHEEETTAVIESFANDNLLVEDITFHTAGFNRHVKRLYSYDRFRDVYRIVHFDNYTSHIIVLEGAEKDGKIQVSNLHTDTSWSVYQRTYYVRETLSVFDDDRLEWIHETSSDGGRTWITDYRLRYSRRDD